MILSESRWVIPAERSEYRNPVPAPIATEMQRYGFRNAAAPVIGLAQRARPVGSVRNDNDPQCRNPGRAWPGFPGDLRSPSDSSLWIRVVSRGINAAAARRFQKKRGARECPPKTAGDLASIRRLADRSRDASSQVFVALLPDKLGSMTIKLSNGIGHRITT
jgi:hypothetical protein